MRDPFRHRGRADALALAALAFVPVLPFLAALGFYSDDYGLLLTFHKLEQGAPLHDTAYMEMFSARPGFGLLAWSMFRLFGDNALPYHLVQSALIAISSVLFCRCADHIFANRSFAFAASAIFVLLPQLSTTRIWFSAICVAAALTLFLAGTLCLLRWVQTRRGGWKIAAWASWLASLSFYETFAPLMVGAAGYAAWQTVRIRHHAWPRAAAAQAIGILLVGGALIAKAAVSPRYDAPSARFIIWTLIRPNYDAERDFGLNAWAALKVYLLDTIAAPLRALSFYLSGSGSPWALLTAAAGGVIVSGLLAIRGDERGGWRPGYAALFGLVVFALGHAIFLLTGQIGFTAAGVGNRAAVAAAIGVAIVICAVIFGVALLARLKWRRTVLIAVAGTSAALLSLRTSQIAEHWASAAVAQERALRAIAADLNAVPAGSVVLLGGICPYDGPAIVFETDWDVEGALSLLLGRPIRGTVVTPALRVGHAGAAASIYGYEYFYPFGSQTFLYDARTRKLSMLPSLRQARQLLTPGPRPHCPAGYPGQGVPI